MSEGPYFIRVRGKVLGPFTLKRLKDLRSLGQFGRFHEISQDRKLWTSAATLTEVFTDAAKVREYGSASGEAAPESGFAGQASATPAQAAEWFYVDGSGQRNGPLTETDLLNLASQGQIELDTPVWCYGMADWAELSTSALGERVQLASDPVSVGHTSGMAVAAFVCSLIWFGGLGSLLAIVFGFLALSEIRQSHGQIRGKGLALAAVILGFVVLGIMAMVCILVLFLGAFESQRH
jgi:hypothetical protein